MVIGHCLSKMTKIDFRLLEPIDIRIKEQSPLQLCHIFFLLFLTKAQHSAVKSFVYNLMAEYRKNIYDKPFIGCLFFLSKYFAKQFSCLNLIPFQDWTTPKPRWLFVKVFFLFQFFCQTITCNHPFVYKCRFNIWSAKSPLWQNVMYPLGPLARALEY